MSSKILLRRGTAAQWTSANPTLGVGELGIETDTLKIKVGNGSSTWTQLTNYINVTPSGLSNSLGDYILLANQGNAGGPAELDSNGDLLIPENSAIFWNDPAYSYTTTLTTTQPTANRVITFPNATGTVALTSDITSAVTNLINAAPSALDTLNELAAAINNDSSFSTTVNNLLNGKVSKSGGDTITASTASTVGLIIKGATSQTANLQEWQNSSGTALARIKANGNTVLIGALTVNQSNTFEVGDNYGIGSFEVKGTSFMIPRAATGIGLIIRGFASQTADLQQWQDSSGNVQAKITAYGDIYTLGGRIFRGSQDLGANVNILVSSSTQKGIVVKGAASQTANLQEWQNDAGTALTKIDNNAGFYAQYIEAKNTAGVLVSGESQIKIASPDGLKDIRFWNRNDAGGLYYYNSSGGSKNILRIAHSTDPRIVTQTWQDFTSSNSANYGGRVNIDTSITTAIGMVIRGVVSQTANLQEWQSSDGTVIAKVDINGSITAGTNLIVGNAAMFYTAGNYYNSTISILTQGAGYSGIVVRGQASQTADLQQWQNSNGTVLLSVSADGTLNKTGTLNIGPVLQFADPGVGNETKFNFQKTNDSAYLIVKEKAADQTYYEFGMWDNALDSQDYFQWYMGQWSGWAGYGWMPLQLGYNASPNGSKSQTLRFTGEQSVFWSPILTGSNTPYYTTNPNYQTHQDFEVTKGWAYTANSTNIPRTNASGGATLNIDLSGYTYASRMGYRLIVDAGGTTFSYTTYGGDNSSGSAIAITGGWQTLSNGTKIKINGTAAANDDWQFLAFPTPRVAFGGTTDTTSLVTIKPSASDKGLVIRAAASPTVSIQEWQNSSGTVLANIDSTGRFLSTRPFRTDDVITAGSQTATLGQISAISSTSSRIGLVVQGAASQTADLQQWQTSTGQTNLSINFGGALQSYIQTTADNINSGITSFIAKTSYANVKPMIVMGAASQTANLQEWQDSAGTIKSYIASDGSFSSSMDATINSLTIGRGGGNQISNVAIGLAALLSNTTGVGNTQIGLSSGQNITTGSYNVGVGNYTNLSLTTGISNTSIGTSAGSTITTGSNITVLGYDAEPSSPTISNEITLGNANVTKLRIPGIGVDWTSSALNIGSNRVLTTQDEKNIYITDSGTARTLGSSDAYKILEFTSSSSITVTIPNDASDTTFPIGSYVEVRQMGGGQITVSATSPATLVATDNQYKTRVQYSAIVLEKRASNAWYLAGDTTA
jgi:hypothetical protein